MSNINKITVNGTTYDIEDTTARASSGLTADVKSALLACFEQVAWINEDGQDYYNDLYDALYPPANLASITCVYTQSGTVYDTDSLDSLKSDLVVTAHWDDTTTSTVASSQYTLSGTLTTGTSTITVTYGGKTTTFNVTVSAWYYPMTLTDSSDGVAFGSFDVTKNTNTPPYVSNANSSRIHCMGTDALGYPIRYGYTYTFTVASGAVVDGVACRTFNEDGLTQLENVEAVTSSNTADGNWNSFVDGKVEYTPSRINGKDPVAMWFAFKKNSNGSERWDALTDLTPITITETAGE